MNSRFQPDTLADGSAAARGAEAPRLFGRGQELSALSTAFDTAGGGTGFVALVSGPSGSGKTALAEALREPVRLRNGFFLQGKFNQYQREVPLVPVREALNELGRLLLSGAPDLRLRWKTALIAELGDSVGLLTALSPELEALLGRQAVLPDIPPLEALPRFVTALRKLLGVVCRAEHPAVLFLDDWQWADAASLEVLRRLQAEVPVPFLLMILAFRDNEVDEGHPLRAVLAALRLGRAAPREFPMRPLSGSDVEALLADRLAPAGTAPAGLAEYLHRLTSGNPLFADEFLRFLLDRRDLWFDASNEVWRWAGPREKAGDDLVALFAHRIGGLTPASRKTLLVAACLGSQFDLDVLAAAGAWSVAECGERVKEALEQHLLLALPDGPGWGSDPVRRLRFAFRHDSVQQAAHSLIAPEVLAYERLEIGRLLTERLTPEQVDGRVLEVADHFNAGIALVHDPNELAAVVQLNLTAARRARAGTAYRAELSYCRSAARCLALPGCESALRDRDPGAALQLFTEWAESEFVEGDPAQAERCIREAMTRATGPIEKANVLAVSIRHRTIQARYAEAIEAGRQALAPLGLSLPDSNFGRARDVQVQRVLSRLRERPLALRTDDAPVSDVAIGMAVKILIALGPPCYRSHPSLWSVIVPTVVALTLEHGPAPGAAYSHPAFGGLLVWLNLDEEVGKDLGNFATRLLAGTFGQPTNQSVFHLMMGSSLRHWFEPLPSAIQDYDEAWDAGLRSDNLQYAAYAVGHRMYTRFFQGVPLDGVVRECAQALEFSRTRSNHWTIDLVEGGLRVCATLTGAGVRLPGGSELEFRERLTSPANSQVACIHAVLSAQAFLLLGEHAQAMACSDQAEAQIQSVGTQGLLPWPEHVFTRLVLLAAAGPGPDPLQEARRRREIDLTLSRIQKWAALNPETYGAKLLFARAEVARLDGHRQTAFELYSRAAIEAAASGFTQWAALAHERASSRAEELGWGRLAHVHWERAYAAYTRWGAGAKLRRMEAEFHAALNSEAAFLGDGWDAAVGDAIQRHLEVVRGYATWVAEEPERKEAGRVLDELGRATAELRREVAARQRAEAELWHHRRRLTAEVRERTAALEHSQRLVGELERRAEELADQRSRLTETHAGMLNLMEDLVAERNRVEQAGSALRTSERKMRALLASMDDLVFVLDDNLVFQEYHQPAASALLLSPDAFVGRRFEDIDFPEPARGTVLRAMEQTLRTGEATAVEYVLDLPAGRSWFEARVTRFSPGDAATTGVTCVVRNVTEARRGAAVLAARARLLDIVGKQSLQQVLRATLDEAEALTGSRIGFYHFVEPDESNLSLQVWSTNTMPGRCSATGEGRHYSVNDAGVWVDCLRTRRPVIHNDYASLPHRRGLPEGHAELVRELVVPVMRAGRIVALLGVGNKPSEYGDDDVAMTAALADIGWDIAERQRVTEQLVQVNATLEQRVLERTAELSAEIRERKRAEHDLRLKNLVFDASIGAISIADVHGIITEANDAFVRVWGFRSRADVVGRPIPEFISDPAAARAVVAELDETGRWEGTYLARRCDGSLFTAYGLATVVRNEEGLLVGYQSTVIDVSDQVSAEKSLVESNRRLGSALADANALAIRAQAAAEAKGRFLAHMSHEIRTPLNAILGYSQLLQGDPDIPSRIRDRIGIISRNGEHLLALISDILQLSKIEANAEVSSPVAFNLRSMLVDLQSMFRQKAEERHLTLDAQRLEELPSHVVADEHKVRQVLINLIGNAVKFTTRGGIRLGGWLEAGSDRGRRLVLQVGDTGPGIAAGDIDRVFQAFEQTAAGRGQPGTGLGLAISRQLARLMGGDLTVSTELGKGSVFRFEIPVSDSIASGASAGPGGRRVVGLAPAQPPCQVLIVEDTDDSRALLSSVLTGAGFCVAEAVTAESAVAACERTRPELVLMDHRLPDFEGDEAIRRIRRMSAGAGIKIIMVSASATDEIRRRAFAAGADDYVAKPFGREDLLERIRVQVGVRYTYAEADSAVAPPVKAVAASGREQFAALPADVKLAMTTAAACGRQDELLRLIDRVAAEDQSLAEPLRDLALRFDYDVLLELLD